MIHILHCLFNTLFWIYVTKGNCILFAISLCSLLFESIHCMKTKGARLRQKSYPIILVNIEIITKSEGTCKIGLRGKLIVFVCAFQN